MDNFKREYELNLPEHVININGSLVYNLPDIVGNPEKEEGFLKLARNGIPLELASGLFDDTYLDQSRFFDLAPRMAWLMSEEIHVDLMRRALYNHNPAVMEHPLYGVFLWKYFYPEQIINFINEGVSPSFFARNWANKKTYYYVLACRQAGVEPDVMPRERILQGLAKDNNEWSIRLAFRLDYKPHVHEKLNGWEMYESYLKDKYGKVDEVYHPNMLPVLEALSYRGLNCKENLDQFVEVVFGKHQGKGLLSGITNCPNLESYLSMKLDSDALAEVLKDYKGDLPRNFVGDVIVDYN